MLSIQANDYRLLIALCNGVRAIAKFLKSKVWTKFKRKYTYFWRYPNLLKHSVR